MHYKEARLPTNTGRLAEILLPNCKVWLRGQQQDPIDWNLRVSNLINPIFLYPSTSAKILSKDSLKEIPSNPTLLLADGNWRQATKIGKRISAIQKIPHFLLPKGKPSQYQLRHEPREGGLATFEALARALGIIESKNLQEKLESAFHLFVRQTLKSRSGQ